MRIVGGKWAGRHLTSPADRRVRPTAEGVRDAWMKLLETQLEGARVVDLFAGTGALGLEALSRGARYADFVEDRPASLHALKANVAALRVRERVRIFKKDALRFAAALEPGSYDVAFADPPYGSRMLDRLIEGWRERPFAPLLAVEHAADHVLPSGGRRYEMEETTAVTLYRAPRRAAPAPSASDAEADRD
ncbi:MAG TPA: RsmD family RNA methyltransferase [Longimicrobiaceae bacterium]|nr:RsmD family RNA methyltransferase [Longimicrobiaceae bacterium]